MIQKFVLILAIAGQAAVAHSAPISVQASQGKVEFHAVGRPSMIKVNGEGKGPEGTLDLSDSGGAGTKVTGDLKFDMTSLSSGISMRDEHMKDKYLEVQKFPEAKLHVTDVALPAAWSAAKPALKDASFKGDLTLHGVTKPIEGKFEISGGSSGMNVKADFEVKLDQFAIEIPKYLGITIKNEIPVELSMHDLAASTKASK